MSVTGLKMLSDELGLNYLELVKERVKFHGTYKSIDLSKLGLSDIPSSLSAVKDIFVLDLRENSISSLPDYIYDFPLRALQLENNRLNYIPDNLLAHSSLRDLYLGGNQLSDLDLNQDDLPNLQVLQLSRNRIERWEGKIALAKLRVLYLSYCNFQKLPNLHCPRLRRIEAHSNRTTEFSPNWVLPELVELELDHCNLVDIDVNLLKKMELERLSLSVSYLQEFLPELLATLLEIDHVTLDCMNHEFGSTLTLEEIYQKLIGYNRLFGYERQIRLDLGMRKIWW